MPQALLKDGTKKRMRLINATKSEVHALQLSMAKDIKSCFAKSELDNLCIVIRLTVEFHAYLRSANLASLTEYDLRYNCESIFSGIEFFSYLSHAYGSLAGAKKSKITWGAISKSSLKKSFMSTYQEFKKEQIFEKKCRLLLDLFKLQIVFAGMFYS